MEERLGTTVRELNDELFQDHLLFGDRRELMRTKNAEKKFASLPAAEREESKLNSLISWTVSSLISWTVSWAYGGSGDGLEPLPSYPIKRPH